MTTTPKKAPTASELVTALAAAINSNSGENASDTPDFILAEFLDNRMAALNVAVVRREEWHGRTATPTVAERAEAEAAQEPGDSVEGLMRECADTDPIMLDDRIVLVMHPDRAVKWRAVYMPANREPRDPDDEDMWCSSSSPLVALDGLRDMLNAAAPATDECLFQHTNNDEEISGES